MYTRVENLVIKPHERDIFAPKGDYPKAAILMHHTSYYQLVREMSSEDPRLSVVDGWKYQKHNLQQIRWRGLPVAFVWASDTSEDAVHRTIEQYFWGAKTIINVGAAGAIDSELKLGDYVVGEKALRNNRSQDNLASPDEEAVSDQTLSDALFLGSDGFNLTKRGGVWSVNNMMYRWDEYEEALKEHPLCVEREMAAICITAGWLNFNYEREFGRLAVGNFLYMSDIMPHGPDETWTDTMNDLQLHVRSKKKSLILALEALRQVIN